MFAHRCHKKCIWGPEENVSVIGRSTIRSRFSWHPHATTFHEATSPQTHKIAPQRADHSCFKQTSLSIQLFLRLCRFVKKERRGIVSLDQAGNWSNVKICGRIRAERKLSKTQRVEWWARLVSFCQWKRCNAPAFVCLLGFCAICSLIVTYFWSLADVLSVGLWRTV